MPPCSMPSENGRPAASAARSMTSCALRPAARSSRTPVAPSAFDSFRPSASRTSGWWANVGAASRPRSASEADLGGRRGEQVAAADDQVDALAQVVDDDRRTRTSSCPSRSRTGRVAVGRDLVRARADESRPSTPRSRPRGRPAAPARREPGRGSRPGSPDHASAARGPRPTPRTSCASSRSRRPCRRPAAGPAPPRTERRRRTDGPAPRRRRIPATRGPRAVRCRTRAGSAPGRGPRSAAGRRPRPSVPSPRPRWHSRHGRDGGSRSGRARNASGPRRRPQAPSPSPGSPRARSRASSARVAAISRR